MEIEIAKLEAVKGVGNYREGTACVMSLAALLDANRRGVSIKAATDELECADPCLRWLLIRRHDGNNFRDSADRTAWMHKMAPLVLGTRNKERCKARAEMCAEWAINIAIDSGNFTPQWKVWADKWLSGEDRSAKSARSILTTIRFTSAAYYAAKAGESAAAAFAGDIPAYFAFSAANSKSLDSLIEQLLDDCKKHPAK